MKHMYEIVLCSSLTCERVSASAQTFTTIYEPKIEETGNSFLSLICICLYYVCLLVYNLLTSLNMTLNITLFRKTKVYFGLKKSVVSVLIYLTETNIMNVKIVLQK